MTASTEIWPAFFKTSGMLAFVIAVLVLVFYLVKRFSSARGGKGSDQFIRVLAVHYLSPKEKLVLLDVMDEKILIGVTPQTITRIAAINGELKDEEKSAAHDNGAVSGFSGLLAKAVNFNSARKKQGHLSALSHQKSGFQRKSEFESEKEYCEKEYNGHSSGGGGNG